MAGERKDKDLTLHEANALELRELNVSALDAQVEDVWAVVDSMLEPEVVSAEILAAEISV